MRNFDYIIEVKKTVSRGGRGSFLLQEKERFSYD